MKLPSLDTDLVQANSSNMDAQEGVAVSKESASDDTLGDPASWDDATLVAAIRMDRHEAFAELVRRYSPVMYSVAWRVLGRREDAEDAVQEAILKFWHKPSWHSGGAALSSWLYRMALTKSIDMLRRNKRKGFTSLSLDDDEQPGSDTLADTAAGPDELYGRGELAQLVTRLLQHLPERQRSVVVLCYFERFSYREAADILNTSVKAVESLAARARVALRALLTQHGLSVEDL